MDNNFCLFREIGVQNTIIEQYLEVKLTVEQSALLEDICHRVKAEEDELYFEIRDIFQTEFELDKQSKIVLLQYINTKTSLLSLLINSPQKNDYYDFDVFSHAILAITKQRKIQISKDDVYKLCEMIADIPFNNIETYKSLAHLIKSKTNLSNEITEEYKLDPNKSNIYLTIYLLESSDKIKNFITEINSENYINILFIVRACLLIIENEREFTVNIITSKLSLAVVPKLDKLELVNQYILLLFNLLLEDEEAIVISEIKRIVNKFENWDPAGLLRMIYPIKKEVSANLAESLFLVVNKMRDDEQKRNDYVLDDLFSQLGPIEFEKYYLTILSLRGDGLGKSIMERLQKDIEVYLNGLVESSLVFNRETKIAIKVLKVLLKGKTVDVKSINEKYYLYLLRCFHCYEMGEAPFICDIAIEFYLNSSNEKTKYKILEYIVSSISENYFMTMKEMVSSINDPELDSLNDYLIKKDDLIERGMSNPDFKPSTKNMESYFEKKIDLDRKIHEKAREGSALLSFVQNQTILYGNKVKNIYKDPDGKVHTQENTMAKMEHSIALPVRFIHDPLFYKIEINNLKEGFLDD
ncbi:hypothetical protein [Sediminibacillus albus]|uniref:Uncharacterized protein n=1 Tax=Sediminibacillus albus TaxID=407036 RepID=A0A1G9A469_9BACI|nr:hypothetical protein [Sediminibacillus albus]SDK22162.1 hypothetical protein SAMN05216243_2405 [Sediminibacillus albus]